MLPLRKSPLILPARPSARRRIACPAIIRTRLHLPGLMPTWAGQLAPAVTPGSTQFTSPGGHNFTVPNYNVLNLDLYAAGGGGGIVWFLGGYDFNIGSGAAGGHTYVNFPVQVIAYGGGGGRYGYAYVEQGPGGTPGSGANGTVINGGGAAGGAGRQWEYGGLNYSGGNGGNGGRVYRTFTLGESGAPAPNSTYYVEVGSGGAAGQWIQTAADGPASPGNSGGAYFSWS